MSISFINRKKPINMKTLYNTIKKNPLKKLEYKSYAYMIKEYGSNCDTKYKYNSLLLENLLFNKSSHIVAVFKDYMIADYIDEFLKRFYKKKECFKKIPQFSLFYTNYQTYFCIPTYRKKYYNKVIHKQREKKAKCFYNEKFKNKESHSNSENDIGICAASMGGKSHKGKFYLKNKTDKNKSKCFFNDEVKEILERESSSNYSMSLHESGSKLKSESSYLLNSYSNEESLCNIINGLYKKKVFYMEDDSKRTNDIFNKKNMYSNSVISLKKNNSKEAKNKRNNNVKLVIKKRIINIKNKNINFESSEYNNNDNNSKRHNNLSAKIINKLKVQNLKIFLNNKEQEKSASNKKYIKKIGLWNIINDKENRRLKSQDNNIFKKAENLLTFHKSKKLNRNISYATLYRKKSLPTSKSNISTKIKSNQMNNNNIQNILKNNINNTRNSDYSREKINNMKKRSYRPIRLSKSNLNLNNNDAKNQNEILLNKIKSKVYDILQKKAQSKENLHLKRIKENSNVYNINNLNYNTAKITPNKLTVRYHNINPIKENNFMTNNYRRNNNKFDLKPNSNIFKSNKLSKSPSISEFVRYIRIQKYTQNNNGKSSQRKYQTLEGKNNNIQNLNININNQINIKLNNINEIPSENNNNKKEKPKRKLFTRNKNKSLDFNTNQNYIIKDDNNIPTLFTKNNKKRKFKIFSNNNLFNNIQNKENRINKFTYYKEK